MSPVTILGQIMTQPAGNNCTNYKHRRPGLREHGNREDNTGKSGKQDRPYSLLLNMNSLYLPISSVVRQCYHARLQVLYLRLHELEPDTVVVLSVQLY